MFQAPDKGDKLAFEVSQMLVNCSARGLTPFEEKRVSTLIEKIPEDHLRFMFYGMYYVLQGNSAKAIEYHEASLQEVKTLISFKNYSGSLMMLGKFNEAIDLAQRAVEIFPDEPEAHHILSERYLYSGFYVKALSAFIGYERLVREHAVERCSNLSILNDVLGKDLESDHAKLHQEFFKFCQAKHVPILPFFTVEELFNPEGTEADSMIKVMLTSKSAPQPDVSIVSDFIIEHPVIEELSPDLLMRQSLSLGSI